LEGRDFRQRLVCLGHDITVLRKGGLMGKKILAVDDDPLVIETLKIILKKQAGYEKVLTAGTGKEALDIIAEEKPDLVLLDIKMPGMDGIETLREIRKIDSDLKVIMLTCFGTPELESEARKLGVSDFLRKQLGIEAFLKTVIKFSKEVETGVDGKEKKKAKILVVDDEPGVLEALYEFLTLKEYEVIKASNGKEALAKVKKERPHLVLLDIKMPEMSGMEVLKKIKEVDPSIGVIMATGFEDMETAQKAMELGAYDYITKPFNLEYLETSVLSKITLMVL
jgi:YesN/AraC family two-component response regulator